MADGKSNDGKTTDLSKLYEQSFWLYTVIIALAIRQVLVGIIPRIFNHWLGTAFQLEAPGTHNEPSFYIELFHSLVFLVVITRFYLGGVKVFAKLTQDPSPPRSWLHVLKWFHSLCVVFRLGLYTFCHISVASQPVRNSFVFRFGVGRVLVSIERRRIQADY